MNNPLPDLSKWHEVPADADITSPVPVAVLRQDDSWLLDIGPLSAKGRAPELRYFTADPIPAPRPAPPTEPGTVLVDVTTKGGGKWDHAYCLPNRNGDTAPWRLCNFNDRLELSWCGTAELVSWTVADVTPRTDPETIPEWERELLAKGAPDPLDENDHRPRVRNGQALTRRKCGRWHTSGAGDLCPLSEHSPDALATFTLASWNRRGPVRFADEVQS